MDDRFSVKPAHATTPWRTGRREDSLGTMAIVGGGAAGFAAADAIRKLGWRGGVTIFSDEAEQPYDRTLLTKDYLEGAFGDDRLPIARHSLVDLGVDFEGDASVQKIEPEHKRLRLANGGERTYEKLLLATGAAPRRLDVPGADLPHVMMLRSLQDCRRILANVISGARVLLSRGREFLIAMCAGRGVLVRPPGFRSTSSHRRSIRSRRCSGENSQNWFWRPTPERGCAFTSARGLLGLKTSEDLAARG